MALPVLRVYDHLGLVHAASTVRIFLADFAVLYCTDDDIHKALCDENVRQIEGNGRKFSHIELSISFIR